MDGFEDTDVRKEIRDSIELFYDDEEKEKLAEWFIRLKKIETEAYTTLENDYDILKVTKFIQNFTKTTIPEDTSKLWGYHIDTIIKLLEDPDMQKILNYKKEIYTKLISSLNSFTADFQKIISEYHRYCAFVLDLFYQLLKSAGSIKKNEKDNSYVMVK